MNQIVVFGLIIFFLTRIIGFMISLDFYLKTKQFKFKMSTIGWLLWGLAAIFPILTFNTLISNFLLFYNLLGTLLGMTFLGFSLISYFLQIKEKYLVLITAFILILSHLMFLLLGTNLTNSILGSSFTILWFLIILSPIIRWKNFIAKVDRAIWYWFFLILAFSFLYIPIAIIQVLNGYSYGLYDLSEPIIISFNYGYGIVITTLIIVISIHLEYKVTEDDKRNLKDKYSHDLGNVIQAVNTSFELIGNPTVNADEEEELRDTLRKKLKEAADLIKFIREL